MSQKPMLPFNTSSMPTAGDSGTGAGSVYAKVISKGASVSKYTPQGTIRPFGEAMGTADDATVLDSGNSTPDGSASIEDRQTARSPQSSVLQTHESE
jgi:hypothetical protein